MATQLLASIAFEEPNISELTRQGWSIISSAGPYYTVWKDCQEMLLLWKEGHWLNVNGSGCLAN